MRNNKLNIAGLLAVASLAASGSGFAVPPPRITPRKTSVHRAPVSNRAEITAWNAAVDAKKAAKKLARAAK